jgi:hypothetical protein
MWKVQIIEFDIQQKMNSLNVWEESNQPIMGETKVSLHICVYSENCVQILCKY